ILRSEGAEIDARPDLVIEHDQVQASHGCAVGWLDEDALFYLRARGIEKPAAEALLFGAFAAEALAAIAREGWRERLMQGFLARLGLEDPHLAVRA
ncbi:MAG: Fe-S cluster assembly protein SufD, partial [Zetaproteobacteria bacterium]